MSEETRFELGLKTVLAECVEALRDREDRLTHYHGAGDESRRIDNWDHIARTRAALAVVERWAAVVDAAKIIPGQNEHSEQMQSGSNYSMELWPPTHDAEGWALGDEAIDPEDAESTSILDLAAALECRRRNGEV